MQKNPVTDEVKDIDNTNASIAGDSQNDKENCFIEGLDWENIDHLNENNSYHNVSLLLKTENNFEGWW